MSGPGSESLEDRHALGIALGLDVIEGVYRTLGRPGATRRTAHLVGTNGKGSTAGMLEHGLRGRGLRTGLYTSPHLHRRVERVRIDGEPVAPERLDGALEEVFAAERSAPGRRPLSFFEALTLAALGLMERAEVDVMVVEAGLGARRDATRIITADVVAITSIGLDHQETIGPTIEDIAREKAGALVPGKPAFSAMQEPVVARVLEQEARAVGSPLVFVPPMAGTEPEHERQNRAVALAVGRVWRPELQPAELHPVLPGRLERRAVGSGELWLDVAHNPAGIAAVVAAIEQAQVPRPERVVFGCHPGKDREGMLGHLRGLKVPIWWCGVGPAAADRSFGGWDDPSLWPAIEGELTDGRRVLCCGSHGLVGRVRARSMGDDEPPDLQDPRAGVSSADASD